MFKHIFLILSLSVLSVLNAYSQHEASHENHEAKAEEHHEEKFNMGEMIMHHITDEHGWEFTHSLKLPLPVILLSEGKLTVFSSARFDENGGVYNGFKLDHHHIYKVNAAGEADHHTKVWDLSITKNVASLLLSTFILLAIFFAVAKGYNTNRGKAPKGIQSFFEPVIVFIRDEVVKPNVGPKYDRYLPYLLTLFFFILINNLMGLLPGAANLSGNITVTLVLAFLTFIIVHFSANKHYWLHLVAPTGVPPVMYPLFWIIEFIGVLMKPASLCIRLFANITGGHIIILSLLGLIFVFKSYVIGVGVGAFTLFMSGIEIMVAFIQAFIFTLLTSMYIGSAIEESHEADHGH
jgi:F-type H+-transporting ATPase subunit a